MPPLACAGAFSVFGQGTPDANALLQQSGVDSYSGYNWSFSSILQGIAALWADAAGEPLQFAVQLCIYLVLGCLAGVAVSSGWKSCLDAITLVGLGSFCLAPMMETCQQISNTAKDCQTYLAAFVPVYAGVAAAAGQGTGALVYSGLFYSVSAFLAVAIQRFLLPIMQIYLCFSISAALWGNPGIAEVGKLLGRCFGWLLKGCGALFSFVLGLQAVLAGGVDSAALKTGKSLLSGFIPLVGDAAAAALVCAASAARLLKGALALALVLAMAAAFAPVVIRCILYLLAFYVAGIVAVGSGQKQCGQVCSLFVQGTGLCIAVLILLFFIVVLSAMLILVTGNGG